MGDQNKQDDLNRHVAHVKEKRDVHDFGGETWRKINICSPTSRWKDVKVDLKENYVTLWFRIVTSSGMLCTW